MRQFTTLGPDGVGTLSPPHADTINVYSMNGSNAQAITWPAGASFCNISAAANYYVGAAGHAAVVPAGAVTDGTGSGLNIGQRSKYPGEASFSIISPTAQYITVEFWSGKP